MPASMSNDLRSEARAYQRDKNHNTKWARGVAPASGTSCSHGIINCCDDCGAKPANYNHNSGAVRHKRLYKLKEKGQATTHARTAFRQELADDDVLYNSGNDRSNRATTVALPREADFMYSYDSTSGPVTGRNVLSAALDRAVLRFENTETEKLVTREYDVIDHLKEGCSTDESEEDDYEMVEHAHLK